MTRRGSGRRSRRRSTLRPTPTGVTAANLWGEREVAMGERHGGCVIVGVAQSTAGLQALRWAVAEARRRGTELVAVRAWRFNAASQSPALYSPAPQQWRRTFADAAKAELHDA